jgi:hypothetical protein
MEMENGAMSWQLAAVVVRRLRPVMIIVQNSVMIDIGVQGQHVRGISGVVAQGMRVRWLRGNGAGEADSCGHNGRYDLASPDHGTYLAEQFFRGYEKNDGSIKKASNDSAGNPARLTMAFGGLRQNC